MKQLILITTLLIPLTGRSQKTVQHLNLLWVNYQNVIVLNDRWFLLNDAQFRTRDITDKWVLFAIRSGVSYNLNASYKLAAGLTWFGSAQYTSSDHYLIKNEWRPWQDISQLLRFGKVELTQRLRTEERFLQLVKNGQKTTDYETVFRLRYKIDIQKYLHNPKWNLRIGNEVMVNPLLSGTRFFDQNRIYAGIGYQVRKNLQLQLQYMKIFQWRSATSILENQDVVRVNISQQFGKKHEHAGR